MEHTFVVPAYRESAHLRQCLTSLVEQSVKSRILITTSTPSVFIEELASEFQVEVRVNPEQRGIGADWNFALDQVSSNYVTIAHQDDFFLPEYTKVHLEYARNYASERPILIFSPPLLLLGDQLVAMSKKNFFRQLFIFPFHFSRCVSSVVWKRAALSLGNPISCSGVFFVKSHLDGFRFDTELKYTLDWLAWVRLAEQHGAFIYVPRRLHVRREHQDSATSRIAVKSQHSEELLVLNEIWKNPRIARFLSKLLSWK